MNTSAKNPKNIVVAKTILSILPDIESYCEMSKKLNHFDALNSFSGFDDTYELMEKIIDKTFAADRLINLKTKTLKMLDAMPEKYGKALKLYFLEKKTVSQVALKTGASGRSISRYIQQGLAQLAAKLESIGMNYFGFKHLTESFRWVKLEFMRQVHNLDVKS